MIPPKMLPPMNIGSHGNYQQNDRAIIICRGNHARSFEGRCVYLMCLKQTVILEPYKLLMNKVSVSLFIE